MPSFQNDSVISVSNSISTPAVRGESKNSEGVRGVSHNGHGGVVGVNDWTHAPGTSVGGRLGHLRDGIEDIPHISGPQPVISAGGYGVYGQSTNGIGVVGESTTQEGVCGLSHSAHGAVVGINDAAGGIGLVGISDSGIGLRAKGGELAAKFVGHVTVSGNQDVAGNQNVAGNHTVAGDLIVTGNIDVVGAGSDIRLTNADCAEDFDICGDLVSEPGTVMVLGDNGALSESQRPYDKRVAGVISGAGDYKPAIVLDARRTAGRRQPVALMGKVFCKVDAEFGPIEVGDMLTTSSTPGHAMAAAEPVRAFGTIIGKALRPLPSGKGLIPILVGLQ